MRVRALVGLLSSVLLVAAPASAAPPAPVALSSLGVMRKVPMVPMVKDGGPPGGVSVSVHDAGPSTTPWHVVKTSKQSGLCIEPRYGPRLIDETSFASSNKDDEASFLVRLVRTDGKATLEKQRYAFDPKTGAFAAGPRVSVALTEVASADGVVVWAYREGPDVVLVTRGYDSGFDSPSPREDEAGRLVSVDGCPYGLARLDAGAATAGASAELVGSMPTQGKGKGAVTPRFFVDASLARLSRDPEPLLTVRVRVRATD
jgi:hypothetical protein